MFLSDANRRRLERLGRMEMSGLVDDFNPATRNLTGRAVTNPRPQPSPSSFTGDPLLDTSTGVDPCPRPRDRADVSSDGGTKYIKEESEEEEDNDDNDVIITGVFPHNPGNSDRRRADGGQSHGGRRARGARGARSRGAHGAHSRVSRRPRGSRRSRGNPGSRGGYGSHMGEVLI